MKAKPTLSMKTEKLDYLREGAEKDSSPDTFMDPVKKRGRPKGSKNKQSKAEHVNPMSGGIATTPSADPQRAIDELKPVMRPMWSMISNVGVKLSETPEAAIGATEMEILVNTSAACVNQYLPGLLGTHANLVVLSCTFGQWAVRVYLLRLAKIEQYKEEFRQRQAAQGPTASPPPHRHEDLSDASRSLQ